MIGVLQGVVHSKKLDGIVLMVSGVGYLVFTPLNYLSKIKVNDKIFLNIHTHVREDQLNLYGFSSVTELELFELLLNISGIGPKSALSIVNRGVDGVSRAVIQADVTFFTSIPRLGTKNAQKIIIELKTKLGSIRELELTGTDTGETQDVIDALVSVGFTKVEALTAIKNLPESAVTVEDKIKSSLKMLGKNR